MRATKLGLVVTVAGGILLLFVGYAEAHAFLVASIPVDRSHLSSGPPRIVLRFSEPIAGGEHITLTGPDGRIAAGPAELSSGGLEVRASVPSLGDGGYTVLWSVVGDDGDVSTGTFAFVVGTGPLPPPTSGASLPVDWPEAALRWILLGSGLVGVGALFSERFIWGRIAERVGTGFPRLPVDGLLLIAVSSAAALLAIVASRLRSGTSSTALPSGLQLLGTRPGELGAIELMLLAYAGLLAHFPRARPGALLPSALALGVEAVNGHAGTSATWWAGPAGVVHLLNVAVWVGALSHLVLIGWRARRNSALGSILVEGARRYAAVALVAAATAVLSGLLVALAEIDQPRQLVESRYGLILTAKVFVVAGALGLALVARTKGLGRRGVASPDLLRRLTAVELGVLLLAVFLGTSLASSATPVRLSPAAATIAPLATPVIRSASLAGPLAVYAEGSRGELQVRVLQPDGSPADAAIVLRTKSPGGTLVGANPASCGVGCVLAPFRWRDGRTVVSIRVTSKEWGTGTTEVGLSWPPGRDAGSLLQSIVRVMRAVPRVMIRESVWSGIGPRPTPSSVSPITATGRRFVPLEPYSNGGATDIRSLPKAGRLRQLTFFLPGSAFWFQLSVDDLGRIRRETIVAPGHLIERRFSYTV